MGFVEYKQYVSEAEIKAAYIARRARLMGAPIKKAITRPQPVEVVKALPARMPLEQDAHVNARYRYLAKNPEAMKKAIVNLVADAVTEHNNRRLRAVPMIRDMCYLYDVTFADIISPRRSAALALVRQKMMWVIRKKTHFSTPEIGKKFGGRDHSTVWHAVRKIDALIAANDPSVEDLKGWLE